MNAKFGRRFSAKDGQFDFFGQFEVERYLNYNGYSFVDRFDANSFLYLAKALDLYDVAWGCESMAEAFSAVTAPIQFFAFTSDWLYPPYQTKEMVTCLEADFETAYKSCKIIEIEGLKVPVIGINDLKKNIKAAGRHKDLADLDNLE